MRVSTRGICTSFIKLIVLIDFYIYLKNLENTTEYKENI